MDEPLIQEKVHIIFKLFMYYRRSQCALYHSILSFVKLFFGINLQG